MPDVEYHPIGKIWDDMADACGRRCVMSAEIDDATLDAETERQIAYLRPLIWSQMLGHEKLALDYGCGAGRFIPMLAEMLRGVVGFDPSNKLIHMTPSLPNVAYCAGIVPAFFEHIKKNNVLFDLIFICNVLGGSLDEDLPFIANWIERSMAPNALLILCEHTEKKKEGTWWRFRPMQVYADLFQNKKLRRIGEMMQLENSVTIMAGRRQ